MINITIHPLKHNALKYILKSCESIVKQKFSKVKKGLNVMQCNYIVYQIPP
jgi:hypothetical protein